MNTTINEAVTTLVRIEQTPEIVVQSAKSAAINLTKKLKAVAIKDQDSLDAASLLITNAGTTLEQIEGLLASLRSAVGIEFKRYFGEDAEGTLTVKLPWRSALQAAEKATKDARAIYLDKVRTDAEEKQRKADEEQELKNQAQAKKVDTAAKKAGADPVARQEIKQAVLSRPAPLVAPAAQAPAGVGLGYKYGAKMRDFRAFIKGLLDNATNFGMVSRNVKVVEALEKAFEKTAVDSKEAFTVPGMVMVKKPVDRDRT